MKDRLAALAIELAEAGRVPDGVIRAGMRAVIAARLRRETSTNPGVDDAANSLWSGPMVEAADAANKQHYEVTPSFFELLLGPRLKYSACSWSQARNLAEAEEEMLQLVSRRAELVDGQEVLDLGCGWGSFALWAAARFPNSRITAVSNSQPQIEYVTRRAQRSGLGNVDGKVANVAAFEPGPRRFDRIVSIEMLEHVRNHRALLLRMAEWLSPGGGLFVHVFAHRHFAYRYEVRGPGDWMADRFFTGGMMPSRDLLVLAAEPAFRTAGHWTVNGRHYQQTLEAWLRNLDAHHLELQERLVAAGSIDPGRDLQRWRMFLMACSELFGFRDGNEWAVEHYRFEPRPDLLESIGRA